ncbi:hypothetical protein GY45DRAFT_1375978 [Cubamyces sp. BRFM 1775]|nr:hypothetical protein GY45DRAFT_1375978 [Cubamyces sp. BRFM 1775]
MLLQVKKAMEELTGVIEHKEDMCLNGCLGYTGPYSHLEQCPKCGEERYCPVKLHTGKKVGRQQFSTMPPGPQVQAVLRSAELSMDMSWLHQTAIEIIAKTPAGADGLSEYFDIVSSSELLALIADGTIGPHDTVLMFSIDALLQALGASDHPDIPTASLGRPSTVQYHNHLQILLSASNDAQYKRLRRATGLCKPSILSGLSRTLPIPHLFPVDIMHLGCLNIPDLYLNLWRGTIKGATRSDPRAKSYAVLADEDEWMAHGREVERAMPYLPGFFDRPPRNIAEKVNSGYKAIEYKTWFYGYLPARLRARLGREHWLQLCSLVRGMMLIWSEVILKADLHEARERLSYAVEKHEELYYARDIDNLHVVRPCIHLLWHLPDLVVLIGALIVVSQFPMERHIGDLGGQIRLHSNPYANLSHRAFRRCQENAIKALHPPLDRMRRKHGVLPRGALDLGDGYVLLRAMDRTSRPVPSAEAATIYDYLLMHEPVLCAGQERHSFRYKVRKWGRVRLPNETVARSAWKEQAKPLSRARIARCVKFASSDGRVEIGEVLYYARIGDSHHPVAVVAPFASRNEELYLDSFRTVQSHRYQGHQGLVVIQVKAILSVVAMVPEDTLESVDLHNDYSHFHSGKAYFVVEKMGFEVKIWRQPSDPEMDVDE